MARTERAKNMAEIGQLESDVHELTGKLEFAEGFNNFTELWNVLFVDECDSLER